VKPLRLNATDLRIDESMRAKTWRLGCMGASSAEMVALIDACMMMIQLSKSLDTGMSEREIQETRIISRFSYLSMSRGATAGERSKTHRCRVCMYSPAELHAKKDGHNGENPLMASTPSSDVEDCEHTTRKYYAGLEHASRKRGSAPRL